MTEENTEQMKLLRAFIDWLYEIGFNDCPLDDCLGEKIAEVLNKQVDDFLKSDEYKQCVKK